MNPEPVDVLLVSPGTTEGWRRADSELADVLRELGVSVSVVDSEMRVARHFRRTMQLTDLAEAAAMRRALSLALRRVSPRTILCTTRAAAFRLKRGQQDRLPVPLHRRSVIPGAAPSSGLRIQPMQGT